MGPGEQLTLGEVIRRARLARAHTLRSLAEVVGCSAPYISDMENERRSVSMRLAAPLARALGLDPEWLSSRVRAERMGRLQRRLLEAAAEGERQAQGRAPVPTVEAAGTGVLSRRGEG